MLAQLATLVIAGLGIVMPHRPVIVETAHHPYDWSAIAAHMRAAYDTLADRAQNPAPWMMLWRGDQVLVPDSPKWIEHLVTPQERLTQIAARYGVDISDLKQWNKIRRASQIKTGQKLRVLARRIPVPRQKVVHTVRAGETWDAIAAAYRIEGSDLREINDEFKQDQLRPGTKLVVWYDPGMPWTVGRSLGGTYDFHVEVPEGAISIGSPNQGRLVDALQVPETPFFERRNPDLLWGSSHAVRLLVSAFANFRYDTGYNGVITLGSMSLRNGRRFYPHKSHQSGRDVDIHMPLLPGIKPTYGPTPDDIDWDATWGLVRAMIDTGEVIYIFLNTPLQKHLYWAARSMGESHEELAALIQWAAEGKRSNPIVRHSKGHDGHIHVRFTCGALDRNCS